MSVLAGGSLAFPAVTSADVVSLLASVFQNNDIKPAQEIPPVALNAQTMPLLQATLNPGQATSTAASTGNTAFVALVDDKALSNENIPVAPSGSDTLPSDTSSDRISLYTVRAGDSIEQIASMYGVSVNTILWANNLKKGTSLKTDEVLVIMPISGVKYIVKAGDTIASIAAAYKSDADEIANFNNRDVGDTLSAGDLIIIPDAEGTLQAAEDKKQADAAAKAAKTAKGSVSNSKSAGKGSASNSKSVRGESGSNTGSAASIETDSPASHADDAGYFMRPIVGGVRTQGLHGHNGVDLASSYGTPILAAASGQVVVAKPSGWNGGYGSYVVIQHPNGMQTLYAHLSEVLVQVGQAVTQGEEIAHMGSTGDSTGNHVHFEVRGGVNPF